MLLAAQMLEQHPEMSREEVLEHFFVTEKFESR
jgi:hypothetical protein